MDKQTVNQNQGIAARCAKWVVAVGLSLGLALPAFAQSDRAQTFEFGIQLADLSGGSVQGVNGASLDFDNDLAVGIFGGYNITNRFAVGAELTWADPAYQLKRATDGTGLIRTLDAELDIGSLLLKATFNFLEGPFTPYVEAGAGWIRIDSNVVSDVDTGCWWDPWWGYVCADFYDTYSDTRTGYTYAVGLRWDISDEMLLRASYGVIETDTNYAIDNIDIDDLRVEFGWKF